MKTIRLDVTNIGTVKALHVYLAYMLDLPDYYGRNLDALHDVDRFGSVIRAKGVVRCDDGGWIHFDYVPGSKDVRRGEADYTGRVCVIGVGIDVPAIKGLFGL